jgi:branched-chain amino acid transport system substrate-binding protein
MLTMSTTRALAVVVVLVAASLAGGAYAGYQSGYNESLLKLAPDIQKLTGDVRRLTEINANVTRENEVLRKAAPSIAGKTVRIGYIAPETGTYTATKVFIEKVIQPDLNAYASSLGSGVSFEFIIENAEGKAVTHLELVKNLHNSGVDVFIGGGWTSQGTGSLNYVNANKMLMVSPSSTSPTYALANDRFYRMSPADNALPLALADVIWSYGIEELVIIQRGDSYDDGIVNLMVPIFTANGGALAGPVIRYAAEATEFSDHLMQGSTQAEEAITRMGGDTSRVGVLLLAFDEAPQILKQASQYDALYNLTWFGGDGTAKSQAIIDNSPLEANHIKLFSLLARSPDSIKYTDLEARYVAATGEDFSIYRAYLNDAAWVLAKSILEIGSDNATRVAAALPGVCEDFYGATGWCRLNRYGDRAPPPFDIWYYSAGTVVPSKSLSAATYYPDTGATSWNMGALDFTIKGP